LGALLASTEPLHFAHQCKASMKVIQIVGGLGSQMMAYAFYISMSERSSQEIICDFSSFSHRQEHNGVELQRIFGIEEKRLDKKLEFLFYSRSIAAKIIRKIIYELGLMKNYTGALKNFNYDEDVFVQNGNVRYFQCWTSWKYFQGVEQRIIDTFKFPNISEQENIRILELIENSNSVSVHLRRGDYLSSNLHANLAPDLYYKKAIKYIFENVKNPNFFVFSNDIEWCKENIKLKNIHYIDWNNGQSSFRDMQLMSHCKHNIIPNSTFSWWGAYLNRNPAKIVISPERWANPGLGVELNDMNMPDWVVIKNY
jgi:hypothetical protein